MLVLEKVILFVRASIELSTGSMINQLTQHYHLRIVSHSSSFLNKQVDDWVFNLPPLLLLSPISGLALSSFNVASDVLTDFNSLLLSVFMSRDSRQGAQTIDTREVAFTAGACRTGVCRTGACGTGGCGTGEKEVPLSSNTAPHLRVAVGFSDKVTSSDNSAYKLRAHLLVGDLPRYKELLTLGQTCSLTPTSGSILSIEINSLSNVSGLSSRSFSVP